MVRRGTVHNPMASEFARPDGNNERASNVSRLVNSARFIDPRSAIKETPREVTFFTKYARYVDIQNGPGRFTALKIYEIVEAREEFLG